MARRCSPLENPDELQSASAAVNGGEKAFEPSEDALYFVTNISMLALFAAVEIGDTVDPGDAVHAPIPLQESVKPQKYVSS